MPFLGRHIFQLFIVLALALSASAASCQTEFIECCTRNGCFGHPGPAPSMAELRFSGLYQGMLNGLVFKLKSKVPKIGNPDKETFKQALREKFDNKNVSCAVTLNPDGSISDLKVLKPSGSEDIDKKALDLIREAAPFFRAEKPVAQGYEIAFPYLEIKELAKELGKPSKGK